MSEFGRGVLRPDEHAARVDLTRHEPGPAVSRFVEYYWLVRWHVDEPYDSRILSHPNVHLAFESGGPLVYGVDRGLFVRRLEGSGQALGVKFRPGGFRPFAHGSVTGLTDRRVAAADFFGPGILEVNEAVLAALAEEFLAPRLPSDPDPLFENVAAMVGRMLTEPTGFRVDEAAAALHLSTRTLQRLFAEYVGVSPKWVLRRARLQKAATRADRGDTIDWAALAA
ncbi:MAG: helix-turn-helix domain-containing protein, partial [Streptosporangiaceae bacterium]